jgi:CheY-like chemotaxis protein
MTSPALNIPVIVVDDTKADRYIARRRLAKHRQFAEVIEMPTGEQFLAEFFIPPISEQVDGRRVVVLMDINMPRLNGFETVAALQAHLDKGGGPDSMVVMMFTSSNNPADRQRAAEYQIVKGYIVKPLDDAGVAEIMRLYEAA